MKTKTQLIFVSILVTVMFGLGIVSISMERTTRLCEIENVTKDVCFTACNENSFLCNDAGGLILERYGHNLTFSDTSVIYSSYSFAPSRGIEYADSGYVNRPGTLTDKRYVDNAVNYISMSVTDPLNANVGYIYFNTALHKLRIKTSTGWQTI